MTTYHCSYCEKEFKCLENFSRVKDGNKILFLHTQCVPLMSGGVELKNIEKECGVEWLNRVFRANTPSVHYSHPITGQYHRLDGPAVVGKSDHAGYWIDGKKYTSDTVYHYQLRKLGYET